MIISSQGKAVSTAVMDVGEQTGKNKMELEEEVDGEKEG